MQSCMYVLSKLAEVAKFPEHHIYPNDISAIKKVYFFLASAKSCAKCTSKKGPSRDKYLQR